MALTIERGPDTAQEIRQHFGLMAGRVVCDDNYPSGGYDALALVNLLGEVWAIAFDNSGGYLPALDRATNKLIIYSAPGAEVAPATDLTGITFQFIMAGKMG